MTSLSVSGFLKAGTYLRNWSPATRRTYGQALSTLPADVTKESLEQWVIGLRERGLSPGGVNLRIRTVNSFLTWMREEGKEGVPGKLRLMKAPKTQPTTLSVEDVHLLVMFKPTCPSHERTRALALLLLDTGLRIKEALSLTPDKVDLDGFTLRCRGKGDKDRLVPFSPDLRRVLFIQLRDHSGPYVFGTRDGRPLEYQNARRDIIKCCRKAGITKKVHPHLLRHSFACHYLKSGGDLYRLSRLLGHSSVATTELYLRSMGFEDLRAGQPTRTLLHR